MAKAVGSKLTENDERSEKHEQVLVRLCQTMQKVTTELGRSREASPQAQQELVLLRQKLQGVNGNMKWGIRRSVGSVIKKYTESADQVYTMGDARLPSKPNLGDARVGYMGESSNDLPTCLSLGGNDRK